MNKDLFIKQLKNNLKSMQKKDIDEITYDYEEHINSGIAGGKTEEEIIRKLGNPKTIARSYKIEAMMEKSSEEKSVSNIIKLIFSLISLSFFNLIFIIGPYLGLFGVVAGLWATALALVFSGIAGIAALIVCLFLPSLTEYTILSGLGILFASVGITALGLLCTIGMIFASKWFYRITIDYVKFNIRIAKGK